MSAFSCAVRCPVPLLAAAAFVSCDPAAEPSYLGNPLLTVRGQVTSSGPIDISLEAAMLWQRGPPPSMDDQELATRAPVQTGFPATFTLHLYQPPPAAALRTLLPGQVTYARANAAAVPQGAAGAAGAFPQVPAQNPDYGLDPAHWVMYLASDVPPGSLMEWWLGAALPAGFHLMKVRDAGCIDSTALAACVKDLVGRGVTDDGTAAPGTARFFCTQPYRLSAAPADEELVLVLSASSAGASPCPSP
jgi:hypothetical protein